MHSHAPGVVYVLGDATFRTTLADGRSSTVPVKAGDGDVAGIHNACGRERRDGGSRSNDRAKALQAVGAALLFLPPDMALQRTDRPRIRSGRSLRSLGSPRNVRRLGVTATPFGSKEVSR